MITNKKLNIKNHLEALLRKLLSPFKISESLKNAMTLPLKVIPPISTVIKDKIIIKLIAERLLNSDQAKKKDDKPPNPLNNATISGIEVIFTFKAKAEPIKAPSSTAESTSTGFTISMTVTSTAKSIPMELTKLPLAAVLSFESIFKP